MFRNRPRRHTDDEVARALDAGSSSDDRLDAVCAVAGALAPSVHPSETFRTSLREAMMRETVRAAQPARRPRPTLVPGMTPVQTAPPVAVQAGDTLVVMADLDGVAHKDAVEHAEILAGLAARASTRRR